MDDIKNFTRDKKELETQIQTVRILSQNIGRKFKMEKCAILIIKKGKKWNS